MNEEPKEVPEEIQQRLREAAGKARSQHAETLERRRRGLQYGCRFAPRCKQQFWSETERDLHETERHKRREVVESTEHGAVN
jgi:hypothetical protein